MGPTMPAPVARRVDRANQPYLRLRTMIIRGRLAPGTRVVENEVAARLGVSRTPAREAIHRLFQEGFLVATLTARRTELVVAPLTHDDMVDLYRIMAALEGAAARESAALDPAARRALVRDLKTLEAAFEEVATAQKLDYDRMFESHDAFHERLTAAARPRLRALIETVRPQVDRYEWVYAPLVGPDYSATFREHAAIVKAAGAGDAEQLGRAVAENWERSVERLGVAIAAAGARGDW